MESEGENPSGSIAKADSPFGIFTQGREWGGNSLKCRYLRIREVIVEVLIVRGHPLCRIPVMSPNPI